MSLQGHKIKFEVNGITDGKGGRSRWLLGATAFYVLGIAAAVSLVIFAPYEGASQGAANVMANIDYKFVDGIKLEMLPSENSFAFPGEESRHVMTLRLYSDKYVLRLRDFRLKIGGIDMDDISNVRMVGEDGKSYKGYLWDGYVQFKNLYLKSKAGEELKFDMYLNFSEGLEFGNRLHFELASPDDLDVTVYGDRVYAESAYPLVGPYISIVGKKKMF